MNEIQLLYVENTISRKRGVAQQALTFCFYVRNLAYDKQVEVRWTGEDGGWQTLSAAWWSPSGEDGEIWLARTWRQSSPTASLPGNVEFVASYRSGGAEYWCKPTPGTPHANFRGHFTCQADAGLRLGESLDLLHIGHQPRLQLDQKTLTVDVAIGPAVEPQEVFVEWSVDGWRTKQRTPCFYARDHWDKAQQSVARNPNQYGVQIWTARAYAFATPIVSNTPPAALLPAANAGTTTVAATTPPATLTSRFLPSTCTRTRKPTRTTSFRRSPAPSTSSKST